MKQIFFTLLVLLLAPALSAQGRRLALLVGVGDYADSKFTPLNAGMGLRMMRATLRSQGFVDEDILTLADAGATREGIRQAFRDHLLQAGPGDIAVFYFYGHGTQIRDDNGDEADRLDEAFVPADGKRSSEYHHENLIRDDALGEWMEVLRRHIGSSGQVLVLLDACHSGSGLRGQSGNSSVKPAERHLGGSGDIPGLAPLVVFYSSMPHQNSLETPVENGERIALFSWAFCKALAQMGPGSTYRGLFEQTALNMAARGRKQSPQFEGAKDMQLFGGRVSSPPPYFKAVGPIGPQQILLAAGRMHGLHPGTRLALYPSETRDTAGAPVLAHGEVKGPGGGLLESHVALDRPVGEEALMNAWVFVTQRRFPGYALRLGLEVTDPEQRQIIRDRLSGMDAVQLTEDSAGIELTLLQDGNKILLRASDGSTVWEERYFPGRTGVLREMEEALSNYLQAQFLRSLTFDGSRYSAAFTARLGARQGEARAGLTPLLEKDTVYLRVVNRGAEPIYYTILDIDARNVVQVLLPPPGIPPAEYRLEPGAESPPLGVRFTAPGHEVLKLIATPVPIDLRDAIATRGRVERDRTFIENLFAETFVREDARRGPSGTYQGNEAGVETVVVEVVE